MRIGVLGTGAAGRALAARFAEVGHDVALGTREVDATRAKEEAWYDGHPEVRLATQAEAAAHGEIVVNVCSGAGTLAALANAGASNLAGKVLVDVSNPLDFSQGFPPTLFVKDTDSLAERVQREFPETRVVKALNMVANEVMTHPLDLAGGDHTLLISGNDEQAKSVASGLLRELGWADIFDLGDLSNARGQEMWMALWTRLYRKIGHVNFNIKLVR
ncbi:oxidoreductase [Rhizocola hellebori]|uniref:Oxidoreductase n=1 Tax=Rhizocola hellebori TaxID=1392758 RepID=A0A8J3Q5Z6_9ACTN|nr:NAD(P)-binding domain-containing protein [Rhizocola hellebori]GIH04668.1 oxidoreductase [Rhizocola hellebori]